MGRRLLAGPPPAAGSRNASRSSNSTNSSLVAQGSLTNFTAVDVNVTLYATIDSFFTRLGQKQFIESAVLSNSMQTLGYSVRRFETPQQGILQNGASDMLKHTLTLVRTMGRSAGDDDQHVD